MITIYAADGTELAAGLVRLDDGEGLLVLADLDRPEALLEYYFGRGGSRVGFELDGRWVEARLATRWRGTGRVWQARAEGSVGAKAVVAVGRAAAAG